MRTFIVFFFLLAISSASSAFSIQWITEHTGGKVTQAQAAKIVQAVYKHSFIHEVDPNIIFKIMQNESTYNPNAKAKTSNATGLMQVIPYWHRDKIKGRNLRNIDVNVEVGVKIYKEYLDRSNGNVRKALWRYNASSTKKQYAQKVLSTKAPSVMLAHKPTENIQLSKRKPVCQTDQTIDCLIKHM